MNFSLLQISSQLRNSIFTKTQRKESISLKFLLVVLKSFPCFCYIAHLTMSIFTIKTVSCGNEFLTVSNVTEKQKFVMAAENVWRFRKVCLASFLAMRWGKSTITKDYLFYLFTYSKNLDNLWQNFFFKMQPCNLMISSCSDNQCFLQSKCVTITY